MAGLICSLLPLDRVCSSVSKHLPICLEHWAQSPISWSFFVVLCIWVVLYCGLRVGVYHIFFIHSSVNWFHNFATVNIVATNKGMQVSPLYSDFNSFWYISRSGIATSYSSSIFSFLRNLYTGFNHGCTSWYSHQQYVRTQFTPASSPASIVFCFLDDTHSVRNEMASQWCFYFHFLHA
jgi:hypothetical protein